eukprot:COSAG03_NODE_2524_length_2675_cov_3968.193323_1_plen_144_part_00
MLLELEARCPWRVIVLVVASRACAHGALPTTSPAILPRNLRSRRPRRGVPRHCHLDLLEHFPNVEGRAETFLNLTTRVWPIPMARPEANLVPNSRHSRGSMILVHVLFLKVSRYCTSTVYTVCPDAHVAAAVEELERGGRRQW